jgi:hypothetical protein
MCTAPPDPGEEQRGWNCWKECVGHASVIQVENKLPSTLGCARGVGRIGREGVTGPTASKIRESVDSIKTYSGLGGVSIAPVGFTKITSTANTTSAAVDDYEHIRRPCFHIRLARFVVVSSLSPRKSSTIPSRGSHNRLSHGHLLLDFHNIEHRRLGHDLRNYATLTSPTTLEVEDTLAHTPCPEVWLIRSVCVRTKARSALSDRPARLAPVEGDEEKAETRCRSVAAYQRDVTSKTLTAARRVATNEK